MDDNTTDETRDTEAEVECALCANPDYPVPHDNTLGHRVHCTCDLCF